jgi:polyisoprenyl-phosphate glycosyltransferase
MKHKVTVLTPCFNEEENVFDLVQQIREVFQQLPQYDYEHVFIDNASTDMTVDLVKQIAETDKHVKLIVNVRNFGHIRSPYYGLLQSEGDIVMLMASDLQDPPTLIPEFLKKWEEGYKVVLGVKSESEETAAMFAVRKLYYNLINKISEVNLTKNFTGFGLYDKQVIQALRAIDDPYPYFRGLISELGFESAVIYYKQPLRKRGITKNNFYTLYDMAMLGITNHSKVPLRIATLLGFGLSIVSLFIAFAYLLIKIFFWDAIPFGFAPLIIGMFFFGSIQLFFIGILGEYIASINTQVLKRPLVIEKERVNFSQRQEKSQEFIV